MLSSQCHCEDYMSQCMLHTEKAQEMILIIMMVAAGCRGTGGVGSGADQMGTHSRGDRVAVKSR